MEYAQTHVGPLSAKELERLAIGFNDVRLTQPTDENAVREVASTAAPAAPYIASPDGVISLDKLGLEKVYVQAKRWQQTVGRPEVQGFYGALAGQRTAKGVFITTFTFTAQAVDFARSVERVVLVDGSRLADLMIEYEVGVTARTVKVPKLDRDCFDEE